MDSWVHDLFGTYGYVACFLVLLACGLGLPLPEEVTLIGSGMLVAKGELEFWRASAVCAAAILLGDLIVFGLGRRYGLRAARVRWIARVLHPERMIKVQERFDAHGNWATFSLRFFPGVRIPGYFLAGTLGMSYLRFLLLDLLGVLVSVPASILVGTLFGHSIDQLQRRTKDLHLILGFLALSLALILVLRLRVRRPRS